MLKLELVRLEMLKLCKVEKRNNGLIKEILVRELKIISNYFIESLVLLENALL